MVRVGALAVLLFSVLLRLNAVICVIFLNPSASQTVRKIRSSSNPDGLLEGAGAVKDRQCP